jgi:hypothetical protein
MCVDGAFVGSVACLRRLFDEMPMPYADADAQWLITRSFCKCGLKSREGCNGEVRGQDMAHTLARNFATLQTSHCVVFGGATNACKVHLVSRTAAFRHTASIAGAISPAGAMLARRQTVQKLCLVPMALP